MNQTKALVIAMGLFSFSLCNRYVGNAKDEMFFCFKSGIKNYKVISQFYAEEGKWRFIYMIVLEKRRGHAVDTALPSIFYIFYTYVITAIHARFYTVFYSHGVMNIFQK